MSDIKYLCDGQRFQLKFTGRGNVACLASYRTHLANKWVRLVDVADSQRAPVHSLRTTHTYTTCNIVIVKRTAPEPTIYAEDFSHHPTGGGCYPPFLLDHIDVNHMRIFETMAAFTEWLAEVGAVVGECVCK